MRIVVAVLAVAFGLLAMRPIATPDFWWHLAVGRATLAAGSPVFADPFSVAAGRPYVANTWLFDVLLFAANQLGGRLLIPLSVALLAVATLFATRRLARELLGPGRPWTALAVALLPAGLVMLRAEPRPHLAGYLLLVLTWWLARRSAAGPSTAATSIGLVALVVLWAQLHASVFIAPAVAVLASLPWRIGPEGLRSEHTFPPRRHLLALAGVALGALASPDGFRLGARVLAHSGGDANRHIEEMRRLTLEEWLHPSFFLLFAQLAMAAAIAGSWRRRTLPVGPVLASLLGLAMTVGVNRFAVEWALLTLPWLATVWRLPEPEPEGRGRRLAALAMALLVVGVAAAGSGAPSLEVAPVFPVGPSRVLERLGVEGNLFNEIDDGGYLLWRHPGRLRVLVDSRANSFFDPDELWAQRLAIQRPPVFAPLDRAHRFSAVVVRRSRPLCRALAADPEWRRVWFGARDVVFVRAVFVSGGAEPRLAPCEDAQPVAQCRAEGDVGPYLAEVDAMLALTPDDAFLGRLGALLALQCGSDATLPRAFEYLAGPAAGAVDDPDYPWLLALAEAQRGDAGKALGILAAGAPSEKGQGLELAALRRLERPAEALIVARSRVDRYGDFAPPDLLETLAWACEAEGDLDCAARMSVRAVAAGDGPSRPRLARLLARGAVPEALRPLAEAALTEAALAEEAAQPTVER